MNNTDLYYKVKFSVLNAIHGNVASVWQDFARDANRVTFNINIISWNLHAGIVLMISNLSDTF